MVEPYKFTIERKMAFLAALATTCNITKACKAVDISRQTVYDERDEDPAFAEAWEKALERGADVLEDMAKERAFDGVDEPVFYQGDVSGTVKRYSDTLAVLLLKGAKPNKYATVNKNEMTGAGGGPITTNNMSDAQLAQAMNALVASMEDVPDEAADLV